MNKIRMLVGQEGPAVSRVPGQELVVGTDIDAGEAQRLVDTVFAEVADAPLPPLQAPAETNAPRRVRRPAAAPAA